MKEFSFTDMREERPVELDGLEISRESRAAEVSGDNDCQAREMRVLTSLTRLLEWGSL